MRSFPPAFFRPRRSGLSVPITSPNRSTDCRNNWPKRAYVVVVQSQVPRGTGGFCWTHVPRYSRTSGNGAPTVWPFAVTVLAMPPKLAPGSSPYHRNFPVVLRAPCQIFATTRASVAVIVPQGVLIPISDRGSNLHAAGSPITPSTTLSPSESHAWIAAVWNAPNLHCGRKSPDCSMTSCGQSEAGTYFCQLIAGAPASIPSKSDG